MSLSESSRKAALGAVLVGAALAQVFLGAQQRPVFRSGVEVVLIDVNVVDAHAKPVEGLEPKDFTVTVDRKPRKIASVQYINHAATAAPSRGRSGIAGATVLDALSATTASSPSRNVLLVIDTDSLDVDAGMSALRAATAFLDRLPASDRVGVVTVPRLPAAVTMQSDRSETRRALRAMTTGSIDLAPDSQFNVGLHEAYEIEETAVGDQFRGSMYDVVLARECAGQGTECALALKQYIHQVALEGHIKAQRSLDAWRQLADALRRIEGPKTVVFVSGGLGIPETRTSFASFDPLEPALASGQITLYTVYLEHMSLGNVKRPLSPSFAFDDRIDDYGLENLTSAAGGTLVRVTGKIESAFERVATEMSGSYLLGIEVEAGDRDGRPHAVDVKVKRAGVDVRARRRYLIEPEKPGRKRAETAPSLPLTPAARAARRGERVTPIVPELEAVTPELVALLTRAGDFTVDYERRIASLSCDEQSDQTLSKWKTAPVIVNGATETREDWFVDKRRRMASEYVLVKGAGAVGWLHFRDPFQVDGAAVRPRTGRLATLFAEAPATAVQQAAQIMTESASYNLGFGERNMDVPTLALVLLEPANRTRFYFRNEGGERIGGTTVWRVVYTERGSPTVFAGPQNSALPLEGTLWIEPDLGRVVRSIMRLNMENVDAEIAVAYAPTPGVGGLWVPFEVRETYTSDTQKLEWLSRYGNCRTLTMKQ